jgi:hypothetical protein
MQQAKSKAKKMAKLLENPEFNELIIEDFIKGGILDNGINQSLDSSYTIDEIKARQILHRYMFDMITYAEKLDK